MKRKILTNSGLKRIVESTVRRALLESDRVYDFQGEYALKGKRNPNYDVNSDEWQGEYDKSRAEYGSYTARQDKARTDAQIQRHFNGRANKDTVDAANFDHQPKMGKKNPAFSRDSIRSRREACKTDLQRDIDELNRAILGSNGYEDNAIELAKEYLDPTKYKQIGNSEASRIYGDTGLAFWEMPMDDPGIEAEFLYDCGAFKAIVFLDSNPSHPYPFKFIYDVI